MTCPFYHFPWLQNDLEYTYYVIYSGKIRIIIAFNTEKEEQGIDFNLWDASNDDVGTLFNGGIIPYSLHPDLKDAHDYAIIEHIMNTNCSAVVEKGYSSARLV